jgi:hypothetical protein
VIFLGKIWKLLLLLLLLLFETPIHMRLLIAIHLDQSNYLANQKLGSSGAPPGQGFESHANFAAVFLDPLNLTNVLLPYSRFPVHADKHTEHWWRCSYHITLVLIIHL